MHISTDINTDYISGCFLPPTGTQGQVVYDSEQQCMMAYDGNSGTWQRIVYAVTSTVDVETEEAVEWALDRMKAEQAIAGMSAKYPMVSDAIKQLEATLKLCSNLDND
jgi:hypothetical protein